MTREEMHLGQDVRSTNPKDAIEPRGYVFAFRADKARVVFKDNAIRDVDLADLTKET